ncbi:divalent-cation tolerance protein CutA [Pseudoalteromonas fenneropenaei]|uniref:Divalent-cation tolerance protein CutA n=1 Tax=Pseudoalteromonas fenneropenaei TaxID=1737459 RepID=A0ABV7CLT9_9GAMM
MTATAYRLVLTTCATLQQGKTLANALVEQKLAACVNLLPEIHSIYPWQGKICHDSECKMIIKTHCDKLAALQQLLLQLHPYDVPEVQVIAVVDGAQAYFNWMDEVLS